LVNIIVTAFIWIAVIINAFLWRTASSHVTFWALLSIAVSLTIKLDPIYLRIDSLIGSVNYATLISDLILLAGIFTLANGFTRAISGVTATPAWVVALGIAVGLFLVLLFFSLRPLPSTTTFNITYRAQPIATIYTCLLFSIIATIFSGIAFICIREIGSLQSPIARVSATLIIFGCIAAVAMSASTYFMNFGALYGMVGAAKFGFVLYAISRPLTVILLAAGMALPLTATWVKHAREDRAFSISINQLRAAHQRTGQELLSHGTPRARLYEIVVDVHDGIVRHGETVILANTPRTALDRAEKLLDGENSS